MDNGMMLSITTTEDDNVKMSVGETFYAVYNTENDRKIAYNADLLYLYQTYLVTKHIVKEMMAGLKEQDDEFIAISEWCRMNDVKQPLEELYE